MIDSVSVETPGRARRRWSLLRLAVVVVWLLAAATAWWTAPREATYEQARADVAAGRVAAYQWGDRWDGDSSRRWFDAAAVQSSGTLGPLFVWQTPYGRVRWTDTTQFDQVTMTGAIDEKGYSGAGAVGVAQNLRAAVLDGRDRAVDPLGSVHLWLGLVLGVAFLGVVVTGPAPRRGTRWFWFWLVSIAPYGLGLLFWLYREHPWSWSEKPAGEPGRDRGFLGLGIGLLMTFVVSVLLLLLHSVLGDRWVPSTPG